MDLVLRKMLINLLETRKQFLLKEGNDMFIIMKKTVMPINV